MSQLPTTRSELREWLLAELKVKSPVPESQHLPIVKMVMALVPDDASVAEFLRGYADAERDYRDLRGER